MFILRLLHVYISGWTMQEGLYPSSRLGNVFSHFAACQA